MNGYQLKNQHLWWRAGFGPPVDRIPDLPRIKPEHLFHDLLKASENKPTFFDVADSGTREMVMSFRSPGSQGKRTLRPEEKQMLRKQSVQDFC
jgi:hypothetical protein